jgi:hypothetical protein
MKHAGLAVCLLALCFNGMCFAKAKTDTWVSSPGLLSLADESKWVDSANAKLFRNHSNDVINATMGSCYDYMPDSTGAIVKALHTCRNQIDSTGQPTGKREIPNFPGKDDYVIIHVVRWQNLANGATEQKVDKQNWFVVNGGSDWGDDDYASNNRVFGRKQVYLLYLYFNLDTNSAISVRYDVKTTSKIPAYLNNLIQLGQIAGIGTQGGTGAKPAEGWNANLFQIAYVPSDIQVTATLESAAGNGTQLDAKTFDNEGKYHLDFSVGVPIKKLTDVNYISASNTLVPASVEKTKIYASVDYYPWATDIKAAWPKYPHVVAGVAMAGQPLHNSLFAVAYGPAVAMFYFGASLNVKELPDATACSATPTADEIATGLHKRVCPAFAFGLRVSVGAITQSLKSAKK